MTEKQIKTCVMTSTENFGWQSMQEIIPGLEQAWRASARMGEHDVRVIDIDRTSLSDYLPQLIQADNIVFTCFTVKLARLGELFRRRLGLTARYFLHLHNQATIACWPYHAWGLAGVLRQGDRFISSSTADARTFELCFNETRAEVVPFAWTTDLEADVDGGAEKGPGLPQRPSDIPLVYVGRLSAQKNLHLLLYAIRLLNEGNWELPRFKLRVYGAEDDLGSPNMGMPCRDYGVTLRNLATSLGIGHLVEWVGQVPRDELHERLARMPHIFVSSSLHSDENFGMAARFSLVMGNRAVLSRWGGHADFEQQFGKQLQLCDVHVSEGGPWLDPVFFAEAMRQALNSFQAESVPYIPVSYRIPNVAAHLRVLATTKREAENQKLEATQIATRVLRKRDQFLSDCPKKSKIFESYSHPDARPFAECYSVGSKIFHREDPRSIRLVPWVEHTAGVIRITDPHRGVSAMACSPAEPSVQVTDGYGLPTAPMDVQTASRLLALGYAHLWPVS